MSEYNEASDTSSCCASCGIAEIDDVKLKECDDCCLVRYCSDACQQLHRSEHEEVCNKRAAELRDEMLFKQPEGTHRGDCPICCLPLSIDVEKCTMWPCCSKVICNGCARASKIRGREMRLGQSCPFCRKPVPTTEEAMELMMKRVEKNDPRAICEKGLNLCSNGDPIEGFELLKKAAELGDLRAHYNLSILYRVGKGVEKDIGKMMYHLEEAAIGGNPTARHNLGVIAKNDGNFDRAVKHYIIAATQGDDDSIKCLMDMFKRGFVEKDDLAATLRAHQAAADAMKSPQREEADRWG